MNQPDSSQNEQEIKIDLILCEWKSYLQWGHAASPDNKGTFDISKISKPTGNFIFPFSAGRY